MQVDSKSNLPVHILPASLQGIFPEISLSPIHWHGPVEKHNGQGIPAGLGESGQARSKSKGPQLRLLFVTPQALYVCLPQGGVTRFIPMEALYTVVLGPDLLMTMHMTPPHHDLIVRVENQAALDTLLHVVKRLHFMLKGRELTVRGLTTKGGESVLAVTAGGTSTVSGFATGFGPGGLSHQAEERKVTASAPDLASALAVQQESLHTHYLTQLQDSQRLIGTLQSALDEKDRIIESLQGQSGRYTQPNALDMMSASSPAAVTHFSGTSGTAAASPQHFVPVHSSSVAGGEVESLRTRIVAQDRELASQRELIRYLQEQRACGNDVPSEDVLPNSYRIASSRSRSPGATGVHGIHYPGNLTDFEREVVDLRVELGNCEKALRSAQLLIEELRRDKEVLITQHRNEVTEVRARFLSYERILRRVVEGAQLRSGHHASRHFDSILHLLNTEPHLGGESASADEHPPPEEEITSRDGAFGSTKRWKGGRGRGRGGQDPPSAVDLMRHTSGDDHYEPAGAKGNPLPFRSTPVPSPVEEELMQLRYKVAQPGPTPSYGIHDTMCLRHEDDVRGLSRFFQNLQDEKAIGPSYSSGVRTPTGLGTSNETSQKKMGEQSPLRLAMNRSSSGAPQRSENLAGNREDIL